LHRRWEKEVVFGNGLDIVNPPVATSTMNLVWFGQHGYQLPRIDYKTENIILFQNSRLLAEALRPKMDVFEVDIHRCIGKEE
jgi:hypothetical protein